MKDPHRGQPVETRGAPLSEATAAVVMLHGRGATAGSILDLSRVLDRPGFAFIAPQAQGNTWYPLSFLSPWEANEPHVSSALQAVGEVMDHVEAQGVPPRRTMLLGFSQGACLTAEFAARHPQRFGGVAILTGGLIGERVESGRYHGSLDAAPVLLASGDPDPHVPWSRVEETADVFRSLGAKVTMRRYSGRPHTVSQEEVELVRAMMDAVLSEDASP